MGEISHVPRITDRSVIPGRFSGVISDNLSDVLVNIGIREEILPEIPNTRL